MVGAEGSDGVGDGTAEEDEGLAGAKPKGFSVGGGSGAHRGQGLGPGLGPQLEVTTRPRSTGGGEAGDDRHFAPGNIAVHGEMVSLPGIPGETSAIRQWNECKTSARLQLTAKVGGMEHGSLHWPAQSREEPASRLATPHFFEIVLKHATLLRRDACPRRLAN